MRFHQLAIGSRFRLDDTVYRKIDPLTASEEGGGARRALPRSTQVIPLEGGTDVAAAAGAAALTPESVRRALEELHRAALQALDATAPGPASADGAEGIDRAYRDALERLGLTRARDPGKATP